MWQRYNAQMFYHHRSTNHNTVEVWNKIELHPLESSVSCVVSVVHSIFLRTEHRRYNIEHLLSLCFYDDIIASFSIVFMYKIKCIHNNHIQFLSPEGWDSRCSWENIQGRDVTSSDRHREQICFYWICQGDCKSCPRYELPFVC